jgi:hypothetical protein
LSKYLLLEISYLKTLGKSNILVFTVEYWQNYKRECHEVVCGKSTRKYDFEILPFQFHLGKKYFEFGTPDKEGTDFATLSRLQLVNSGMLIWWTKACGH